MLSIYEIQSWINKNNHSKLTPGVVFTLHQIEEAIPREDKFKITHWINQIIRFSERSCQRLELAEVYVAGSLLFYEIRSYTEAVNLVQKAVSLYITQDHPYALAKWIEGCYLWLIPGSQPQAINAWQRSIEKVQTLANKNLTTRIEREWYQDLYDKMIESVDEIMLYSIRVPSHPLNQTVNYDLKRNEIHREITDQFLRDDQLEFLELIQSRDGSKKVDPVPVNQLLGRSHESTTYQEEYNTRQTDKLVRFFYNQQPDEGDIVLAKVTRYHDQDKLEPITMMGCFIGIEAGKKHW